MVGNKVRTLIERGTVLFGALLVVGAVSSTAMAQPQLSDQDRKFLQAAHQGNLAEIAAGRLAQSKGVSKQVKDIAATLVTDHTRLDTAVQQLASASRVQLPTTPNAEQQAMQTQLERAAAGDFDAMFIAGQLKAHSQALALGEAQLKTGSSPEVKKAAADAAPVIRAHHEQLTAAARALGRPTLINTGSAGLAAAETSHGPLIAILAVVGLMLAAAGAMGLRRVAHR